MKFPLFCGSPLHKRAARLSNQNIEGMTTIGIVYGIIRATVIVRQARALVQILSLVVS